MNIQELFATLGLRVNQAEFNVGERLLTGIKTALIAIAGFESARGLINLITTTSEAADHLGKMADRIGVGYQELQRLAYGAKLSDMEMGELNISIMRFSRIISSANEGSKAAKETLAKLGPEVTALLEANRPLEEVMGGIAERFKEMPAGAEKSALAMELFGRSGAQMIPWLNEGRAGIEGMGKEFEQIGYLLDRETGDAFGQLNDDVDRIKIAFTGMRNQFVVALLPALRATATKVLDWVKANRELIGTKLEAFAQRVVVWTTRLVQVMDLLFKVGGVVVSVLGGMIDVVTALIGHIKKIAFVVGVWTAAWVILNANFVLFAAGAILSMLALKASIIATALASAAAWVIGLWPLALLALAIGAVILIVEDLWTWFRGGKSVMKEVWQGFKDVLGWIGGLFVDAAAFWKDVFVSFFDWIMEKLRWVADQARKVLDIVTKPGEWIGELAFEVFGDTGGVEDAGTIGEGRARFTPSQVADQRKFENTINVTVPPGTDAKGVGVAVKEELRRHQENEIRSTAAAVGATP